MTRYVYRVSLTHHWDIGINAESHEDAASIAASIQSDLTQTDTLTNKIHRTLKRFAGGAVLLHASEVVYRHIEKDEQGRLP